MKCWTHIPEEFVDRVRAFAALSFEDDYSFWQPAGIDRQFLTGSDEDMILLKMTFPFDARLRA